MFQQPWVYWNSYVNGTWFGSNAWTRPDTTSDAPKKLAAPFAAASPIAAAPDAEVPAVKAAAAPAAPSAPRAASSSGSPTTLSFPAISPAARPTARA